MSLDPLHERLARLVFSLPEASGVAIAGGNAMLAHSLVQRPTRDLDLFTPDEAEVDALSQSLATALRDEGATVEVDRPGPGFVRMGVMTADGQEVAIEIGQDARMRPAVQLSCGRVLDRDELAADKTLALFGRAAARDLVDVTALEERYGLEALCRLAAEKDPGFDSRVLADALRAASRHPESEFIALGLTNDHARDLKARAELLRERLLRAAPLRRSATRVTLSQRLEVPTPPAAHSRTQPRPTPRPSGPSRSR